MKFYSEALKKLYDSAEACEEDEKRASAEQEAAAAKAAQLKEERARRAKEVEDAFAHASKLFNDFVKDYYSSCSTFKAFFEPSQWLPW